MAKKLYLKLAWSNIKRNKEITIPYILAMSVNVFLYLMVLLMVYNEGLSGIPQSDSIRQVFLFGSFILLMVVAFFFIYLNNFIIKKRLKEYGIYNILGLEKKHVIAVMLLENAISYAISFSIGIILGTIFGRFAFMIMIKICQVVQDARFILSPEPYKFIGAVLIISFVLVSVRNIIVVLRFNTLELMKSERKGDKWSVFQLIMAVVGVVLLAGAYYKVNSEISDYDAVGVFLMAVAAVVIATYLIFPSVSVIILRLLKKNKNFYYKSSNFISIGSLMHRMKQNAMGLASICILSTMVIVTGTVCISLYDTTEASADKLCHNELSVYEPASEAKLTSEAVYAAAQEYNVTIDSYFEYRYQVIYLYLDENDKENSERIPIRIMSTEEYERATQLKSDVLADDEIRLFTLKDFDVDTITFGDTEYKIVNKNRENIFTEYKYTSDTKSVYLVANQAAINKIVLTMPNSVVEIESYERKEANYSGDYEDKLAFAMKIDGLVPYNYSLSDRNLILASSYGLYGGLLVLGVFCIIMFLAMTILIIYFKQVSEGYEDRERFVILQKVGMDKKMVTGAINRQVLTMFFLPLIVALMHMIASIKIVGQMIYILQNESAQNMGPCIATVLMCFVIAYVIVYRLTSKIYYKIVKF